MRKPSQQAPWAISLRQKATEATQLAPQLGAVEISGSKGTGISGLQAGEHVNMALAIIIPLSMLIYSNSRITEAKETLRAEISELRVEMRAGFERIEAAIKALDAKLEHKLEVHVLEHHGK